MKKLSIIFLALFIIAVTACNAGFTSNNDFENSSSKKATLSINVNTAARSTITALEVTEDDVVKIIFRAQKLKKAVAEGTGETFTKDGEAYEKEWANKTEYDDDDEPVIIHAFEQLRKNPNLPAFEIGTYSFELELYTLSVTSGATVIMNLMQYAKIDALELVKGKNNLEFNTKYTEAKGELYIEYKWDSDFDDITKIEAGLFTVESNGKEPFVKGKTSYDFSSLGEIEDIFDETTVNYVEYKVIDLPNGDYYLRFKVYGLDPLTDEEILLNEFPPVLVKIDGYISHGIITLDQEDINSFYTVKCILDEGEWNDTKAFEVTRNAYETVTLPTSDKLIAPEGKMFKGWAECDSSGKLKSASEAGNYFIETKVEATTKRNVWFKAIWEAEGVEEAVDVVFNIQLRENTPVEGENVFNPTDITFEDITSITLSATYNREGKIEDYSLGKTDDGEPVYILTWTGSEKDNISAVEAMEATPVHLEYGQYTFTLNCYTKPTAAYVNESHLSLIGELIGYNVTEETNSFTFEPYYAETGTLDLTLNWAAEDPKTGITSRIGKIEVGLFTDESEGEVAYSDYEVLSFEVKDGFNTAVYAKTEVPNGGYYLKAQIYDVDGKTLIDKVTLGCVIIEGFKTENEIELDLTDIKVYYNVNYVFDSSAYPKGKWKTQPTTDQTRRIAQEAFTLPGSDSVEYEGGGYIFRGWFADLDSDGYPTGDPLTSIAAGKQSAYDYTFYADWEIEESSENTIEVGFDVDRSDLSVKKEIDDNLITYTITPPDETETYTYTYMINGETYQADSNVIVIDMAGIPGCVFNISIIAEDSNGKYYSYNDSNEVAEQSSEIKYELKQGPEIHAILLGYVSDAESAEKTVTAFAKSSTAPAETVSVQYLDEAEEKVPVWLVTDDTDNATIYYYLEEGKLVLNKVSNALFDDLETIKSIETSDFYTSNVQDMERMFADCIALESLDLSMFDISSVQILHSMFSNCRALRTIYISEDADWRYSDIITNGDDLFTDCTQLPNYTSGEHGLSKAYAGEGGYFTIKE